MSRIDQDAPVGSDAAGEPTAPVTDAPAEQAPTLREPVEGIPPLCASSDQLSQTAQRFAAGQGPVALDAERASGHRYGQRAFLIQAKRRGAGIALIDPVPLPDLQVFAAAIEDAEWVLHSATQDLVCLAEVGLRPQRLFDTELAARLLNLPRVGLASLTESLLGWHLAKGHSAADWSIRPLPQDYLRYAALDVELLIELRDILHERLIESGRWEWAQQEFEALLSWSPNVHPEPWRRTAGANGLRSPRQLAALRALWHTRDALADELDLAPGRVLPDASLSAAAQALPDTRSALLAVPGFKRQQRRLSLWWQALESAQALPASALPAAHAEQEGPPPTRSWTGKDPVAAQRFTRARAHVVRTAEQHDLPAEVLISPDPVRRLAWAPPEPVTPESVAEFLRVRGVRQWQLDLVCSGLAEAVAEPPAAQG